MQLPSHLPASGPSSRPRGALSSCQADAGPRACFLGIARGAAQRLLVWLFVPLGAAPAVWLQREEAGTGQWRHPEERGLCQVLPASWAFPAPNGPSTLRGWSGPSHTMWRGRSRGRRIPLTRPACALVLQSADSAPHTSAGWKVRKLLSFPAHSLGLSVPICLGGGLSEDIRGGFGRGSGAARRGLSGGLQHTP